jgi:hypothetical protein
MKYMNCVPVAMLLVFAALVAPSASSQTPATKPAAKAAPSPDTDAQKKNTAAYIALMRRDVRQEKAEIMGSMMALNAQDAAKFWPIYSAYDEQLNKLNDQRVANIKLYVENYNHLTDDQADKMIQSAVAYQKARAELLGKTYEDVRQALGGVTAARFALVEHQILSIIDLQIVSSLPVAGQSM